MKKVMVEKRDLKRYVISVTKFATDIMQPSSLITKKSLRKIGELISANYSELGL